MPPMYQSMLRRWVHSFEEDHDGIAVYRPVEFPFPRARGRRELEFRDDGTFVYGAIGRGDAPEYDTGTWQDAGAGSVVCVAGARRLRATLADADRLEVVDEGGS
jgi:hypothetical protein